MRQVTMDFKDAYEHVDAEDARMREATPEQRAKYASEIQQALDATDPTIQLRNAQAEIDRLKVREVLHRVQMGRQQAGMLILLVATALVCFALGVRFGIGHRQAPTTQQVEHAV